MITPTAKGSVIPYPAGTTRPAVSGVLFAANDAYASGSSILRLSASGQASFHNASAGTVRIIVDVAGYYTTGDAPPTATASRYVPLKQTRILDTQNGTGGVPVGAIEAKKSTLPFLAAGVGGLPAASSISSVVLSLTALNPAAVGGAIVHPSGTAVPGVAHSVWPAKRSKTSTVVTRIGADGKLVVANTSNGVVHFVAEVIGYYTPATNSAVASTRIATVPAATRVLDTGTTLIPANNGTRVFKVAGTGGLPATGLAAVAFNLIVAGTTTSGDIVTYPTGETAPLATDAIAPPTPYSFNQAFTRVSPTGEITILNRSNAGIRVYLDLQAYALKPKTPTAPANVEAAPANAAASVTWQAPADTGDLTLKSYEITRTPGGQVTTVPGTATSATITGLSNDETYTFKVAAVNAVGRSAESAESLPVTPAPQPPLGKPFITSVFPRDSAATVYWAAPADATDSVVSYTVTATPGGASRTVPGTAREAVLTGLTNGTAYAIKVTATNATGSGGSDPRSVTPVPAKVPLVPPIDAVTALNGRLDVQWVRPADGGAAIDSYQVTAEPGGITQTVPADTTITALTGLTNGQQYTVKIRAHNKAGYGDAAVSTGTPSAARAPGVPVDVRVAPSANGSVQLGWKAPIDVGTAPISGYRVTVTPGGRTVDVTTATAAVTGLDPAIDYRFTVAAKNVHGTGTATPPTSAVKPVLVVKVAPTVLTPQSQRQIRSLTPTAIVIEAPTTQLAALQVGQNVVADASATTPRGFLRRITKVQTVNGLLVLNTIDAALNELYDDLGVSSQFGAMSDQVTGFVPAVPGVKLRTATAGGRTRKQGAARVMKTTGDPDIKLYIQNGRIVIEAEQDFDNGLRYTGTFQMGTQFDASIRTKGLSLTSAHFKKTFDVASTSRLDIALGGTKTFRKKLGSLQLACFTIPVGPVPVVICPTLDAEIYADLEGRAGLALEASFARRLGAELTIESGQVTANGINEPLPNLPSEVKATAFANLKIQVGITPAVTLWFWGQGGPAVELSPYLEYEFDSSQDPAQTLVLGIKIGAGVRLRFMRREIVRWSEPKVMSVEMPLWDSGGPFKGLIIDPGSAELPVGRTQQFTASIKGWPDEQAQWKITEGPGTISASGLYTPGGEGFAKIAATVPANGAHPELTGKANVFVTAHVPSEPRNVRATAGTHTALLTWDTPEDQGGNPINHYVVTTFPDTGAQLVPAGDGNRITLRGLTPGQVHVACVTALNLDGTGKTGCSLPFTPEWTTLANPGGSDIVGGVEGTELGIDGVTLSDSGRYAFFATKKADGKFYLVRRDLADGSYETVSRADDKVTPEPIAWGFRTLSVLTTPNYATSGEGRYITYRKDDGSGRNNYVVVRDLASGERWSFSSHADKINSLRLSADGTKVTYLTGNPASRSTRIWQAVKGIADPELLEYCFEETSCGSGSHTHLGVSPDGKTVMYDFESRDPASPYYNATNQVVSLNVRTGEKTLPYLNQGLRLGSVVYSADGSWIAASVTVNGKPALAARKVGTGPLTAADVFVYATGGPAGISDDGRRIAWRPYQYPAPQRLMVYSKSTKKHWAAPPPPSADGFYQDEHVHLASSGAAVSWQSTGPDGHPFLNTPQGAVQK
ncbi:fibronectin type III domain-containing protein [Kribbella deserti]|uniref:Fibronectin type III domain-containing protein n=1 Tax=Kribbella deserti TaxID=1926257 RepID=A0ABV6QWB3_9ACTN